MLKSKRTLTIILIFIVVFSCISIVSAEDNATVNPEINVSGTNFVDIQNAIDEVDENSTLNLEGKNYYANIDEVEKFTTIKINKSLNVVGVLNKTVIDANGGMGIFNIESASISFKNIKFINSHESSIRIHDSNVTFLNCIFENNAASVGGAIQINEAETNIINCTFKNNQGYGSEVSVGGAIAVLSDNLKMTNIINSTFYNNSAFKGGAIYIAANDFKKGYLNINNSVFNKNAVIYEDNHDYTLSGADIQFYNPSNFSTINYSVEIINSNFT